MAREVLWVAVFVEPIDDLDSLVDLLNIFGALIAGNLNVEVVLNDIGTIVGQLDKLFVDIVHDRLHCECGDNCCKNY